MNNKMSVVAIGGNSLIKDNKKISILDQLEAVRETCSNIAELVSAGWDVVITHGNGPQVGFIMRRNEIAAGEIPPEPLEIAVADTQGAIGSMIQQALLNEFRKRQINKQVIVVITQVLVDSEDPAFHNPTKPIGSFLTREEAEQLQKENGMSFVEDAGRGWRRVVPSPDPKKIIEIDAIHDLVKKGYVVVCVGGGGIPVIEKESTYESVSAVIDKDYASALLARDLRADAFIVTTGVNRVSLHFGTPEEYELAQMTTDEAKTYLEEGHFPAGSMGPKIEAILRYLDGYNGQGIITSPGYLVESVSGESGTSIYSVAQ
ncbi:carbamate kinase [Brevibacillus sp. SYSU BS000544]|uniref:carbamate kinase n=1 Tax=Brevibacillus sp. SYSU BS000544 TaxID=3416443 RepID=UPI003CE4A2A4